METKKEIGLIVDDYKKILDSETDCILAIADAEDALEETRLVILKDGIPGKNAEEREVQTGFMLRSNLDWQQRYAAVRGTKRSLAYATAKRKSIEAEIGLLKAWLYSQREE